MNYDRMNHVNNEFCKSKNVRDNWYEKPILLYDSFCNFAKSVFALEILALALKNLLQFFGITKQAIRSEDGLSIFPDDTW